MSGASLLPAHLLLSLEKMRVFTGSDVGYAVRREMSS